MSFTKYQSLEDRVVLVSGGASGIGEAFVRAFADNGARVAFLDLQEEAGQALVKSLAGSARHAPLFIRCDVTRTDELIAATAEARRKLGPASALINNAANDQRQTFADVTPEEFDRTIAVNFRHVYFASQAVVPQMVERGGGSFVFNSSAASLVAGQVRFGYQVAKAGLNAVTRFIAAKYGRHGIRANATLPFVVGGEVGAVAGSQNCIGRSGTAEEIGEAVVFLLSDRASVITGQVIHLDGGLFTRASWPTNAAPYQPPPPPSESGPKEANRGREVNGNN